MGNYIHKIISDNNETVLPDEEDKVWCKVNCHNNKCKFTLINRNIPSVYRGQDDTEVFERTILCESNEQAVLCKQNFTLLLYNGYKHDRNWLCGLDILDLMVMFEDTALRYFHCQTSTSSVDSVLKEIQKKKSIEKKLFIYLQANSDFSDLSLLDMVASPFSAAVDDICFQFSLNDTVGDGQISIDMWYS